MRRTLVTAVVLPLIAVACADQPAPASPADVPELRPGSVVTATVDAFDAIIESFDDVPLIVNFWATWCDPCREEMPRLVAAADHYAGRVEFLGVDVEDDAETAEVFLDERGVDFPSVGDPGGEIRRDRKVLGLPVTQFYLPGGELAFVHTGEISEEDLTSKIEDLLRIAGGA